MSVCVLFFFSQREISLFSFSLHTQREVHTHTHPWNPASSPLCLSALFASAYCIIALTLDFCQGLSIREKKHIHMFWQTGGEGKGFYFLREAECWGISSLSDSWMPACCSSRHDMVFAAGVVFVCLLLLVTELLVCHFTRSFSVFGKFWLQVTQLMAERQHCQGPWRSWQKNKSNKIKWNI